MTDRKRQTTVQVPPPIGGVCDKTTRKLG